MPAKKPARRSFKKTSPKFAPPVSATAPPELPVPPPTQPVTIPETSPLETPTPPGVAHPPTTVTPESVVTPSPSPAQSVEPPASPEVKELASLPMQSNPPTPPEPPSIPSPASPSSPPSSPVPEPDTPSPSAGASSPKAKLMWSILIVILAAALTVAGFAVYNAVFKKSPPETPGQTENTPPASTAPTATPIPPANRSDLKLQVLNGSGSPGVAAEVKTHLESLGYQDVATGNADSYDYKNTEISIKDSKKAYLDQLISDLKSKYPLSEESATVSADTAFDAVIVVGSARN